MPISQLDNDIYEDSEFEATYSEVEVSEEDFAAKKASLYKKTDGIDISKATSRLTLRYYKDDNIVDKETVPRIKDGTSVGDVKEYYLRTSTSDTPSYTDAWTESIPAFDGTNKYLWNYEEEWNSRNELILRTSIQLLSANGKEISSLTEYYIRTTTTSVPQYTDLSKWSTTPPDPTEGKYLWNLEYIVYPDGTTTKTIPQIISANGEDGETITSLYIYIRSSTTPTVPTGSTYSISTDTLSNIGSWSRNMPEDDGYPCWQASSSFATTLDSVSITWNAPTKIADSTLYVSKYTPVYLGAYTYAPTSNLHTGDYYLHVVKSGDTVVQSYLRKWTGSAWEDIGTYSTSTAYYYNSAMDDILDYAGSTGTSYQAATAFITHIFSKYIKATGSIRVGNRYNESGTVSDSSATGAYLGNDGVLKAYGAEITGAVNATSGTFNNVKINESSIFNGYINVNKGLKILNTITDLYIYASSLGTNLFNYFQNTGYTKKASYFLTGIISCLTAKFTINFIPSSFYLEDDLITITGMADLLNGTGYGIAYIYIYSTSAAIKLSGWDNPTSCIAIEFSISC